VIIMAESKEIVRSEENQAPVEQTRNEPVFTPAVDIYESDEGMILMADLPGVDKGDLHISLEEDTLTIEADVQKPADSGSYLLNEYRVGRFYRQFKISSDFDREKIQANLKDGELKLVLPKAEALKPRKIQVSAG
jgi:HSP20 family protein